MLIVQEISPPGLRRDKFSLEHSISHHRNLLLRQDSSTIEVLVRESYIEKVRIAANVPAIVLGIKLLQSCRSGVTDTIMDMNNFSCSCPCRYYFGLYLTVLSCSSRSDSRRHPVHGLLRSLVRQTLWNICVRQVCCFSYKNASNCFQYNLTELGPFIHVQLNHNNFDVHDYCFKCFLQ